MLDLLERDVGGVYNATSPVGQWTMGDLVAALVASGGLDAPRPVWIDEARLLAKNRKFNGTSWSIRGLTAGVSPGFAGKAMAVTAGRSGEFGASTPK